MAVAILASSKGPCIHIGERQAKKPNVKKRPTEDLCGTSSLSQSFRFTTKKIAAGILAVAKPRNPSCQRFLIGGELPERLVLLRAVAWDLGASLGSQGACGGTRIMKKKVYEAVTSLPIPETSKRPEPSRDVQMT